MQEGFELTVEKDGQDKELMLPVLFPVNLGSGVDEKKIVKVISHAPEHKVLVYAIYLQVVEWTLKTSAKSAVTA